jgi:hypothetical protein
MHLFSHLDTGTIALRTRSRKPRVSTSSTAPSSSSSKSPIMNELDYSVLLSPVANSIRAPQSSTHPNPFRSCLVESMDDPITPSNFQSMSPRMVSATVLKRALSIQELDDESWLSSPFISLVMTRFAKYYENVRYFAADFVGLPLAKCEYRQVTDILGKPFDFNDRNTNLVFLLNNNKIHWNLLRVTQTPKPELQLFEPLGLPLSRGRRVGLSLRSIPKIIIDWLDTCFPLPDKESWLSKGSSAITSAHQLTNYDCGVACLLYAEKCGQGEVRTAIFYIPLPDNHISHVYCVDEGSNQPANQSRSHNSISGNTQELLDTHSRK